MINIITKNYTRLKRKKKLFVMNYIEPTGRNLFIYEKIIYIYIYICVCVFK